MIMAEYNGIYNGRGVGFSKSIDMSKLYRPQECYLIRESEFNHHNTFYDMYDGMMTYVRNPTLYRYIITELAIIKVHL